MEPQILYHHPYWTQKFGLTEKTPLITDDEIERLIEDFVRGCGVGQDRPASLLSISSIVTATWVMSFSAQLTAQGRYGGSFHNRTRFLREIVSGIRAEAPRSWRLAFD